MAARKNFEGSHVWDKPGLSGYLVCLVHLVSLMQQNKPDRPNRPNERTRLVNSIGVLLRPRFRDHQRELDSRAIQGV